MAKSSVLWTFSKRFSDFICFHRELATDNFVDFHRRCVGGELPSLPPKKIFSSMEPALISRRQSALEVYARALLQRYPLPQCKALAKFVDLPVSLGGRVDHAVFTVTRAMDELAHHLDFMAEVSTHVFESRPLGIELGGTDPAQPTVVSGVMYSSVTRAKSSKASKAPQAADQNAEHAVAGTVSNLSLIHI